MRRSGNRVRVNVQLIDANTDEHIWAKDYDRDVTDVFAIQTDLAREIADALQAKLSPAEKSQMTRKPTENGEAYLAFVEAHESFLRLRGPRKTKTERTALSTCRRTGPKLRPGDRALFAIGKLDGA